MSPVDPEDRVYAVRAWRWIVAALFVFWSTVASIVWLVI